jgi:hypothetical protein
MCKINSYSLVEDSILFENVTVGRNVKIRRAIIDKDVVIPDGTVIGYNLDDDRRKGYAVTESGIVVVPRKDKFSTFGRHAVDSTGSMAVSAVPEIVRKKPVLHLATEPKHKRAGQRQEGMALSQEQKHNFPPPYQKSEDNDRVQA